MFRRNVNQVLFSFILDWLGLLLAIYAGYWLRLHIPVGRYLPYEPYFTTLIVEATVCYTLVFIFFSAYDPDQAWSPLDEYQILTRACAVAGLTLAGLVYFTARDISRLLLVYVIILHFLVILGWRMVFHSVHRTQAQRGSPQGKILIVDGSRAVQTISERLKQYHWSNIRLAGYVADDPTDNPTSKDLPCLGKISESQQVVKEHRIDHVLIALPGNFIGDIQELVNQLAQLPCEVWLVPDYTHLLVYGSQIADLGGMAMINLKSTTLTGYQRVVKRALDLLLCGLLLVPASLISAIISILIRFDSPGPVIFRQIRVGENGRLFTMYKFRSMVKNAEARLDEVIKENANGQEIHKFPNDPRVTRFGKWLRRTSLDELPQIINVIKGEMSWVGPRPELPRFVALYQPWQQKRFAVPQGLTGWWQVNGRSDLPMHLNTEYDLYYVRNYSLWLDIQVIIKTFWVVIKGIGAF